MIDTNTPLEIPQIEGNMYISGLSIFKDNTKYFLRYLYGYEILNEKPLCYEFKEVTFSFNSSRGHRITIPLPLDEKINNPKKYFSGKFALSDFSNSDKAALEELLSIANEPFKLLLSDTWLLLLQTLPAFGAGDVMNRLEQINAEKGEKNNLVYRAVRIYAKKEINSFKKKKLDPITLEDFYSYIVPACIEKIKKRDSYKRKKTVDIFSDIPNSEGNLLTEKAKEKSFYNVPTSPATDTALKVLGARGSLKDKDEAKDFIERNEKVNHSQKIEVLMNGNKRKIIVTSGVSEVTLEISDIEKLVGNNKPAKKMLAFCLIKINEQAFSGGTLKRNFIQFPIKELIEAGLYKTPQSAKKGFYHGMDILTDMKYKGHLSKGKKTIEQLDLDVLFTGATIDKRGICTVRINEHINWGFISAFYTVLPRYCFKLSNRAFDLLYYCFYLARQNVRAIEERGYFTISMRAVHVRLGLPNENETKNPQRDIVDAIEDAIEAIENECKTPEGEKPEFTITPIYDMNAPIASFLNNGYLEVSLRGKYANDFIELSKDIDKEIQKNRKRQEAIVDKAKEKALIKKLESENTDN